MAHSGTVTSETTFLVVPKPSAVPELKEDQPMAAWPVGEAPEPAFFCCKTFEAGSPFSTLQLTSVMNDKVRIHIPSELIAWVIAAAPFTIEGFTPPTKNE